jgi:hypothetical protein
MGGKKEKTTMMAASPMKIDAAVRARRQTGDRHRDSTLFMGAVYPKAGCGDIGALPRADKFETQNPGRIEKVSDWRRRFQFNPASD